MGWTPDQVGATGLEEFNEAIEGWRGFHAPEPQGAIPSRAEIASMAQEVFRDG